MPYSPMPTVCADIREPKSASAASMYRLDSVWLSWVNGGNTQRRKAPFVVDAAKAHTSVNVQLDELSGIDASLENVGVVGRGDVWIALVEGTYPDC